MAPERFISSLAIRIGLMNVSNLPQGNFLAIDEGWGTMDSDNLNSVAQLFQYLKSQFQFTFVVSHIETMRDFYTDLSPCLQMSWPGSIKYLQVPIATVSGIVSNLFKEKISHILMSIT